MKNVVFFAIGFQNGVMQGVLNILLLNMSAYITKELGMAPGGEFRVAFNEVRFYGYNFYMKLLATKQIFFQNLEE